MRQCHVMLYGCLLSNTVFCLIIGHCAWLVTSKEEREKRQIIEKFRDIFGRWSKMALVLAVQLFRDGSSELFSLSYYLSCVFFSLLLPLFVMILSVLGVSIYCFDWRIFASCFLLAFRGGFGLRCRLRIFITVFFRDGWGCWSVNGD